MPESSNYSARSWDAQSPHLKPVYSFCHALNTISHPKTITVAMAVAGMMLSDGHRYLYTVSESVEALLVRDMKAQQMRNQRAEETYWVIPATNCGKLGALRDLLICFRNQIQKESGLACENHVISTASVSPDTSPGFNRLQPPFQ